MVDTSLLETVPIGQISVIDEARFGSLLSVEDEDGVFLAGVLFFDPWGHRDAQGLEKLARPAFTSGGCVHHRRDQSNLCRLFLDG